MATRARRGGGDRRNIAAAAAAADDDDDGDNGDDLDEEGFDERAADAGGDGDSIPAVCSAVCDDAVAVFADSSALGDGTSSSVTDGRAWDAAASAVSTLTSAHAPLAR